MLADQVQAVEHGGADDNGSAMLIVVEDRNFHPLAQLRLDVEAFRRLDVFQVDAAEGRLHGSNVLDQLVGIELIQLDVEDVDAGELLEQHTLAFHHWLGRQRADVAQTKDSRTIGNDANQVGARSQARGPGGIGDDGVAGCGHAR